MSRNNDDFNGNPDKQNVDQTLATLLEEEDGAADADPQPVASRDDELDSGIVRLADMIGSASAEKAKVPSTIPSTIPPLDPAGAQPSMISSYPPAAIRSSIPGPGSLVPSAAPGRRKGTGVAVVVAVLIVVIGAGAAYYLLEQKDRQGTERIEQLQAQIEAITSKTETAPSAPSDLSTETGLNTATSAPSMAPSAGVQEAKAAANDAQPTGTASADATGELDNQTVDEDGEDGDSAEKVISKSNKKKRKGRSSKRRRRAAKRRAKKTSKPAAAEPSTSKEPKGAESDKLDDLIGGSTKKEKQPATSKSSSSGRSKPSRAEVNAVMGPIAGQARSCASHATGTVQLRITVKSDGTVSRSKAVGSFANTSAGKCVASIARGATFSPFSGSSFTFTYPITLR